MKKLHRHITAYTLTLLYILITLTPLSPLALKSAHIAHAVTGECSGDCDIDGCSLESRANHTCCCWQKKLKQAGLSKNPSTGSRCVPPAVVATAPAGGCCATPVPVTSASCCTPPAAHEEHHDHNQTQTTKAAEPADDTTGQTVFKCGTPCGSGKILALIKFSTDEIIPFYFAVELATTTVATFAVSSPPPLTSRSIEPPEPPPRLEIIS